MMVTFFVDIYSIAEGSGVEVVGYHKSQFVIICRFEFVCSGDMISIRKLITLTSVQARRLDNTFGFVEYYQYEQQAASTSASAGIHKENVVPSPKVL